MREDQPAEEKNDVAEPFNHVSKPTRNRPLRAATTNNSSIRTTIFGPRAEHSSYGPGDDFGRERRATFPTLHVTPPRAMV